jgi:hypothetical protein
MSMASLAISGASMATTGKSVSDHAISAVAQRDCRMWRIIQGSPICREPEPAAGTTAAITLAAASRTSPAGYWRGGPPSAALSGIAPAAGQPGGRWQGSAPEARPGYADGGPYEIVVGQQVVVANVRDVRSTSARLMGRSRKAEPFALVHDDGVLEIFIHEPMSADESDLAMVIRIVDYGRNPDAFAGVWLNGTFYSVGDITV